MSFWRRDAQITRFGAPNLALESKWEAVVGAGGASRLGNPAATTDRSPRLLVS
jgi:hypothetical protein